MRRAADALRLIAASAVLIPAVLLSAFADARVRRTELALLESVVTLPAALRDLLTAIAQLIFVLVPLAILVGVVVRRRFDRGVGSALPLPPNLPSQRVVRAALRPTATVGALGGPMVQIVALAMCVHAVGGELPFVQLGAVYLSAKLISGAAPVPGGLGVLEAGLTAGCSGLGMPVGAAASAVLLYRLLTFWLVIPVGWVSLKMAETRGYV